MIQESWFVSGLPAAGSDSAKFRAVGSVVIVVDGEDVVLDTTSVAVLGENLVDAVLDLMTTLTQTEIHVCDSLVLLHCFLQLAAAVLHADHPSVAYIFTRHLSQSCQFTVNSSLQRITSAV